MPYRRGSIPQNRYQSLDLDDLWRRLYLYAAVLTSGTNVVMHCGLSAEDLATETLNKYLLSPNGLGWRESKGSLTAFLGTILRNKFIDHLRRQREVARTEDDSDESPPRTESARNLDDDIAARELTDRLLNLVKGRKDEPELRDFIHAGSMISEGGKVNQQLADLMGVDEGEVVNRRKKLWRVAGVKELYEEFRHGPKTDQSAD
jgi:DNA-directed RNA polymerase specialized sigma24 family protein